MRRLPVLPVLPVLVLPLLVAGCVAPEPPPAVRRAASPAPLVSGTLEPAPRANRAVRAPDSEPILRVDGLKAPAKTAPPL